MIQESGPNDELRTGDLMCISSKTIAYIRVSTNEQSMNGLSLEA